MKLNLSPSGIAGIRSEFSSLGVSATGGCEIRGGSRAKPGTYSGQAPLDLRYRLTHLPFRHTGRIAQAGQRLSLLGGHFLEGFNAAVQLLADGGGALFNGALPDLLDFDEQTIFELLNLVADALLNDRRKFAFEFLDASALAGRFDCAVLLSDQIPEGVRFRR